MEEFDTSDLAWILYKLFYGIDNVKTIVRKKKEGIWKLFLGTSPLI